MSTITVKRIIHEYMEKNGFNSLQNEEEWKCVCSKTDKDGLMPCGSECFISLCSPIGGKLNGKEIVEEYLKNNDFGGLYQEGAPCGCVVDELEPCDHMCLDCVAGHVVKCDECKKRCEYYKEDSAHCVFPGKRQEKGGAA